MTPVRALANAEPILRGRRRPNCDREGAVAGRLRRSDRAPTRRPELLQLGSFDTAHRARQARRPAEHVWLPGLRQRKHSDAEPGGAKPQLAADVAGLGGGLSSDPHAHDRVRPGRSVRRRPNVEQPAGGLQHPLQSPSRDHDRAPRVVRRDRVVRIVDAGEVRRALRPDPDVLDGSGPSTGRRVEVRNHQATAVHEHLARGLVDGGVRRVLFLVDATIDLAANVGEEVEHTARLSGRQRVRARGHGLRLQDLRRPVVRDLGGDDSIQVLLEPDDVDRPQALADLVDLDRPAVAAAEVQRLVAGQEHERRRQLDALLHALDLDLQARTHDLLPDERSRAAGRIAHAVRGLGGDRQGRLAAGEQDSNLGDRRLADRRPAVVVREDASVVVPSPREAVCSPLAHSHAVAPAAAADQEHGGAGLSGLFSLCGAPAFGRAKPCREERSENAGCQDEAARHGHQGDPKFRRNLSEASASFRRRPPPRTLS